MNNEYVLPATLSKHYSCSLKTVYNYLNKNPSKIRVRKEHWKRFVHFEDFTNIVQRKVQTCNNKDFKIEEKSVSENDWNNFETKSKIQNDYESLLIEKENLKKQKEKLNYELVRYTELHKEERAEKKEVQVKLENLQDEFNIEIKKHSTEKIEMTSKYYRLLILCIVCLIIMFILIVPNILNRIL